MVVVEEADNNKGGETPVVADGKKIAHGVEGGGTARCGEQHCGVAVETAEQTTERRWWWWW